MFGNTNLADKKIANSTKISLLWTNPNPGNDWGSATATLSSDDYDFLVISFLGNKTSKYENVIQMMDKTSGKFFPEMTDYSNGNMVLYYRTGTKQTDSKKINIGNCSKTGDASNTYNHILIPYKIYGVKM